LLLLSPQLNSSSGQGLLFGEWDAAAAQPCIGMCGEYCGGGTTGRHYRRPEMQIWVVRQHPSRH
jgi:hypothetical protein